MNLFLALAMPGFCINKMKNDSRIYALFRQKVLVTTLLDQNFKDLGSTYWVTLDNV